MQNTHPAPTHFSIHTGTTRVTVYADTKVLANIKGATLDVAVQAAHAMSPTGRLLHVNYYG